jgi:hypothetical protein
MRQPCSNRPQEHFIWVEGGPMLTKDFLGLWH